jgi:LCP family protein required for cell wall assembly
VNPFLDRPRQIAARRSWGQRLILGLNAVLIAMSLSLAGALNYAGERSASVNRVELHRSLTEVDEDEPGARVVNILLVGSDSSAALDADDPIQIGRDGERFGDVIIVAHLDERSGDLALLSFPRDLWVPVAGTERSSRINRAFLVGGPAMLIDTIEENFDIPIHHYVNVDFAGFQGLVEAVGSVDVYFETPARDWNVNAEPEPRSQTGFLVENAGCHALEPEQALAYVRSRYYQTQAPDGTWQTDPTSDLGRIARQQDFLQRLLQRAIDRGARNPLVLGDLIDTSIQHVAVDQELTPALLLDLSATYRGFEPGETQSYTYPAVDGTVGANRVLLPRHDEARALRALFGGASFTDPETVAVRLLYDHSLHEVSRRSDSPDDLPLVVVEIVDDLDGVGVEVDVTAEQDLARGLWIRHGPDGAQAARIMATALAEAGRPDASIVEVAHLHGREVDLVVGPGSTTAIGRQRSDLAGSDRQGTERSDLAIGLLDEPYDPQQDQSDPATGGDEVRQGVLSVGPGAQSDDHPGQSGKTADPVGSGDRTSAYSPTRCP